MSVSPTELILSSRHTFFMLPFILWALHEHQNPLDQVQNHQEYAMYFRLALLHLNSTWKNINISNLHNFKTILPGLDVSKQPQGHSYVCYMCVYVCVCVCMCISEGEAWKHFPFANYFCGNGCWPAGTLCLSGPWLVTGRTAGNPGKSLLFYITKQQ